MLSKTSTRIAAIILFMIMVLSPMQLTAEESASDSTENLDQDSAVPLQIEHTPIAEINAATGAAISAIITSPDTVTANVYYRYGYAESGINFESVLMMPAEGNAYSGQIPAFGGSSTLNYYIEAADTSGNRKMTGYRDDFMNESWTTEHWTGFPAQWGMASDGTKQYMEARHSNTRNYLTQMDSGSWTNYDMEFKARFANRADGRGEFLVRADEQGNYYAVEVQTYNESDQVTLKIHYWENTVYRSNLTANVTANFNPGVWNHYRIAVRDNRFTLYVNGNEMISATDANNRYPSGGIGFRSNHVGMQIADLSVSHPVKVTGSELEMIPYSTDFENETEGGAPAGWSVRGDAKVVRLPEGNKVLRLNGQVGQIFPTATFSAPQYSNVSNFIVKFRARYERTSDQDYNVWRLRYRALDDNNHYSMEWGTHNWRYFIMRKTDLGGNYFLGTYNESLENRWVDYELHVSGITHELYINGNRVINVDDSDTLRMDRGYLQFGTVYGINLMIDSLELIPTQASYIYQAEPADNYTGIYGPDDLPGLQIYISGGSEAHTYRIDYTVSRADGDQVQVAAGTQQYAVDAFGQVNETLRFNPAVNQIGTYDVETRLYVDGEISDRHTKRMRIAVVREIAGIPDVDMDVESKFGFNTHYRINWRDDILDAVRKAGTRHHRSWLSYSELFTGQFDNQGRPVFDFTVHEQYINKIKSFGLNSIPVLSFLPDARQAASYEGLKQLEHFMYETVNHYKGTIRQYETPNEPELNAKPYIPYEIVQQWKRAYIGAKKADLDTVFIAGDHTSSVRSVLPPELELGAYYYADAFSWHPYVYNAMPDGGIESFIRDIGEMINEYGGWRDFYLTEGGWPTAQGGFPNVSEEVQRDYIVRAFLIYMTYPQIKAWQYYDFKNDGTDENYYEVFWGISDVDGRPKLAYGAVNNLMTTLSHTVYAGPLDTQDDKIRGYVFMNDYQPVITVWRSVDHKDDPNEVPQTSLLRLNVGSNTVTVRDINGNESIQKTKNGVVEIMVSGSPVYIIGASASVLNDAYGRLLNNDYLDTLKKMEKLEANSPEAARSLRLRLGTIQARLESALKDHRLVKKAEALENCIIDIYDIMKQAAVKVQRGELDREDAFVVSEALYYYAETASNVLIHVKGLQGVRDVNLQYADHLNQARNAYELKSGEHYILPVATSATMRLNRYARMAEMYRERSRYAESAVYQLMTREFAKSVLQIVAADQSLYTGVWLNVSPIRMSGEPGYTSRVTGTVSNETAAAQSVAILLEKPDGWGEVQSYDVEIAPNDVYRFDLPLVIPLNAAKGSYKPKIVVRHEGTVIDEAVIDFRVNDAIQAKLLPVNSPVEELNEITVLLTGISDDAKNGKVIMRGPDGNELLPVSGNTFTNLSKGQSLALTFNWDYRTKHAYNDYRNELSVVDTDNDTVMFEDRQMPLDFLFIPKRVSPIVIDGQLEDWKQAYPVHLRGAERNISGIYDPVNLDATAYAMWDEQHFYIAMVVTDNIHKNAEDAPNLWKNDSIQIAFDPLSDSSANYNSDDMEWGFAMRDDGTHLANIFFSRPPNPNGNVSGQLPYRIIRDEPNQKTFYEIQIPKEMIAHLQLAEGTVFGYNIAVNDADYQMGRDNFIQWTRGLADSKNPGNFDKFTFVN